MPSKQATSDLHHARGHVSVQDKICAESRHGFSEKLLLDLDHRLAHLDAHSLGIVRLGYRTAVIVGQDDHQPAFQARLEHALARNIEVVAVHKGGHAT